jgi:hypothetical protein
MVCLKQMEATGFGSETVARLYREDSGQEMLDALIVDMEQTTAAIKRRVWR